ncbi:TetR/AcrR family transcriptional regulator C-terminal domain-containing protein [Streptomyces sp. NPDC005374]|uniref:TetR/AcrR family transcriptional regulator C-terminal domain-containing protein n=1 Tax=Streptomyces sp. NPDC005374 TaxID=3364713 RepID=UPI00368D2BE5
MNGERQDVVQGGAGGRPERQALGQEQIVRAAIGLLDTAGIGGLSMRRLGELLGSTAAAIYWHVRSKHELLWLASDAVWAELRLPDLEGAEWREASTTMAQEMHAMFQRHSWLVSATSVHAPYGPGRARHDNHLLALCSAAGFTDPDAGHAKETIQAFVIGACVTARSHTSLVFGLRAVHDGLQTRITPRP